jgi:hypothetical protein
MLTQQVKSDQASCPVACALFTRERLPGFPLCISPRSPLSSEMARSASSPLLACGVRKIRNSPLRPGRESHAREKTEIPGKGKGTSTSELLSPVLGQKLSGRAPIILYACIPAKARSSNAAGEGVGSPATEQYIVNGRRDSRPSSWTPRCGSRNEYLAPGVPI